MPFISFTDEVMIVILLVFAFLSVRYGYRHQNWTIGLGWSVTATALCLYYVCISLNIPPIATEIVWRQAIGRPLLAGVLLSICAFLFNGLFDYFVNQYRVQFDKGRTWIRKLHKQF